MLDQPYGRTLQIATWTVLVHTAVYEALKEGVARHPRDPLRMTIGRASVLLLVGIGYAIRACLGLILGQAGSWDAQLLGLTAVGFTALGSMFVAMVWAIDGLTQVPGVKPSDLPVRRCTEALRRTPHILPLLAQAGILEALQGAPVRPRPEPSPNATSPDRFWRHRVLAPVSSPTAWWNAQFVIACSCSAILGGLLVGSRAPTTMALDGAIGAASGLWIVRRYHRPQPAGQPDGPHTDTPDSGWREVNWSVVAPASLGAALLITTTVLSGRGPRGVAACIPFLVVAATYTWFRRASVTDIRVRPPDPIVILAGLGGKLRMVAGTALVILLGEEAANLLRGRRAASRGGRATTTPMP